jgi:hypothetical protein
MKTIIMQPTILLMCKDDNDFAKLLTEGYILKEVKNIKYLIKDEVL